jgi:hypothetical protein
MFLTSRTVKDLHEERPSARRGAADISMSWERRADVTSCSKIWARLLLVCVGDQGSCSSERYSDSGRLMSPEETGHGASAPEMSLRTSLSTSVPEVSAPKPLVEQVSVVRLEVFTAVTMKNGVFWDVTPCGSCKNRRFGRT